MIHAVCDVCGKDCDRGATLLSLTPFQNFARYHTDTQPFVSVGKTRSFVVCNNCLNDLKLPNPYEKCLNNYTDVDLLDDKKYDRRFDK